MGVRLISKLYDGLLALGCATIILSFVNLFPLIMEITMAVPFHPHQPVPDPSGKMESLKAIQHGGTHYKGLKYEPAQVAHGNDMGFLDGSALKYLMRHNLQKDRAKGLEDLKKFFHYGQMIAEAEYGILVSVSFSDMGPYPPTEQAEEETPLPLPGNPYKEPDGSEKKMTAAEWAADLLGSLKQVAENTAPGKCSTGRCPPRRVDPRSADLSKAAWAPYFDQVMPQVDDPSRLKPAVETVETPDGMANASHPYVPNWVIKVLCRSDKHADAPPIVVIDDPQTAPEDRPTSEQIRNALPEGVRTRQEQVAETVIKPMVEGMVADGILPEPTSPIKVEFPPVNEVVEQTFIGFETPLTYRSTSTEPNSANVSKPDEGHWEAVPDIDGASLQVTGYVVRWSKEAGPGVYMHVGIYRPGINGCGILEHCIAKAMEQVELLTKQQPGGPGTPRVKATCEQDQIDDVATKPGRWDVVPVKGDSTDGEREGEVIGYKVRWSKMDEQNRYLWAGHYYCGDDGVDPSLGWCENAAIRQAERMNKDFPNGKTDMPAGIVPDPDSTKKPMVMTEGCDDYYEALLLICERYLRRRRDWAGYKRTDDQLPAGDFALATAYICERSVLNMRGSPELPTVTDWPWGGDDLRHQIIGVDEDYLDELANAAQYILTEMECEVRRRRNKS